MRCRVWFFYLIFDIAILMLLPPLQQAGAVDEDTINCNSVLRVNEIRDSLTRMRGLELPEFVPCHRINSALSADLLSLDFQADNPEEKLKAMSEIFYKFTLEEAEYDYAKLKPFFIFVSGFYDSLTKNVFVVEDDFMSRLLRKAQSGEGVSGDDISKAIKAGPDYREEELVLIHELTHALQDIHYDLMELHKFAEENSDTSLAFKSIIEGDASWVGTEYEAHVKHYGQSTLPDFNEILKWIRGEAREGRDFAENESKFNEILGSMVVFPYIQGQAFMQTVRREYGFERFDEIFLDPPMSSEQIIHTEKYFEERDQPTDIDLSLVAETLNGLETARVVHSDTLGEFGMRSMLNAILPMSEAIKASEGWDGDRYIGFYDERDDIQLVWFTVWDSEEEAEEFMKIYKRYAIDKNVSVKYIGAAGESGKLYDTNWGSLYVEQRGNEVAIIDEFTLEDEIDIEELIELLWASPREDVENWEREIRPADERSFDLSPAQVKAFVQKAAKLQKFKHTSTALELLDMLNERDLLEGRDAFEAALLYANCEKYEPAFDLLDAMLKTTVNGETLLNARAAKVVLLINTDEYDEAYDVFEELFDEYEDVPFLLGIIYGDPVSVVPPDKELMAEILSDFADQRIKEDDYYNAEAALKKASKLQKSDKEMRKRLKEVEKLVKDSAFKKKVWSISIGTGDDVGFGDVLTLLDKDGGRFARVRVVKSGVESSQVLVLEMKEGYKVKDFADYDFE